MVRGKTGDARAAETRTNRVKRGQTARETLEICERGHYHNTKDDVVDIRGLLDEAVAKTLIYAPNNDLKVNFDEYPKVKTVIQLTNEKTAPAAQ